METQFEKELAALLNRYCKDNDSDTPDWILAKYLNECLDNFNAAVKQREEWYGRQKHLSDLPEAGEQIIDLDNTQPIIDYDSTGNPPENLKNIPTTGDKPDIMPIQTSGMCVIPQEKPPTISNVDMGVCSAPSLDLPTTSHKPDIHPLSKELLDNQIKGDNEE